MAYNRPIVDGKVQNPNTGEIEAAIGSNFSGPPSVQISWCNMNGESDFKICGVSFAATVTEVLLEIMEHVKSGVYELVSLNATPYYVSAICNTPKAFGEFHPALSSMQKKLNKGLVPSEEKDMYEKWEKEYQVTGKVTSG